MYKRNLYDRRKKSTPINNERRKNIWDRRDIKINENSIFLTFLLPIIVLIVISFITYFNNWSLTSLLY
jgi:hypothetical protein